MGADEDVATWVKVDCCAQACGSGLAGSASLACRVGCPPDTGTEEGAGGAALGVGWACLTVGLEGGRAAMVVGRPEAGTSTGLPGMGGSAVAVVLRSSWVGGREGEGGGSDVQPGAGCNGPLGNSAGCCTKSNDRFVPCWDGDGAAGRPGIGCCTKSNDKLGACWGWAAWCRLNAGAGGASTKAGEGLGGGLGREGGREAVRRGAGGRATVCICLPGCVPASCARGTGGCIVCMDCVVGCMGCMECVRGCMGSVGSSNLARLAAFTLRMTCCVAWDSRPSS